jgi:hypothetical protein
LYIPPPLKAELFVNVQFESVVSLFQLFMPPPYREAVLSVNVQSVSEGLLLLLFNIPPPHSAAVFFVNVQFVSVGLLV